MLADDGGTTARRYAQGSQAIHGEQSRMAARHPSARRDPGRPARTAPTRGTTRRWPSWRSRRDPRPCTAAASPLQLHCISTCPPPRFHAAASLRLQPLHHERLLASPPPLLLRHCTATASPLSADSASQPLTSPSSSPSRGSSRASPSRCSSTATRPSGGLKTPSPQPEDRAPPAPWAI